ncbi:hypothetical protein BG262_00570 [Floricoccus penangensis]|uniref:Uncharacterized protein n=1 Tax=Floricoccus penangensis TaxID=1859475 RepID=A0A9Q5JIY4_9LACT|nr:DUF349 domain-containing protein [Floricoccus penangensis]OFI48028.1 hypothetical protein BG262_00570 [Floricoccus penangensis]
MTNNIDAYEEFFKEFNITSDKLIDFSKKTIKYIEKDKAQELCQTLDDEIISKKNIYVRRYGNPNGKYNTQKLQELFYNDFLFDKGSTFIQIDPNNNSKPKKLLEKNIILASSEKTILQNYQISHVYGRTKNCYAFTAPWNLVYLPKILDPFTGHESKGDFTRIFTQEFQKYIYEIFKDQIDCFNKKMEEIDETIFKKNLKHTFKNELAEELKELKDSNTITDKHVDRFIQSMQNEFSKINIIE